MSHVISGTRGVSVLVILLRLELAETTQICPGGHLVINILGLGVIWEINQK